MSRAFSVYLPKVPVDSHLELNVTVPPRKDTKRNAKSLCRFDLPQNVEITTRGEVTTSCPIMHDMSDLLQPRHDTSESDDEYEPEEPPRTAPRRKRKVNRNAEESASKRVFIDLTQID